MKKLAALTLICLSCMGTAHAKDYYVTPAEKGLLATILNDGTLKPGDNVILRDGVYDSLGTVRFTSSGTENDSIGLRAEHPGKAIISGPLHMTVSGKYQHIDGLLFHKAWAQGGHLIGFKDGDTAASHCRFTNCAIDDCNDPNKTERPSKEKNTTEYWLMLYGDNIRVDHCYFANKRVGGLVMQMWLSADDHLNNHQIDHNLFGNRPPFGGNGAEIIRIGHSWSSQLESRSVVENNVFLHCDGENEIISVKSCHNILRGNLFFESRGGLVCRHGHYNVIESNTFVGNNLRGTLGIRLINQGHTVYNNHCYRTGGFGLLVRMGVFERPDANTDTKLEPLTSYHRSENINIANNSFVDCEIIDLGSGRGTKEPRNVRFTGNYFSNPTNNIRVTNPELTLAGFEFIDNRYNWADNSDNSIKGFIHSEREDHAAQEKARVTEGVKNIGPAWYEPNANDLRYITEKYN